MTDRLFDFCTTMQDQLHELQEHTNSLMSRLLAAPKQAQPADRKELGLAKRKGGAQQQSVASASSRVLNWFEQKKADARTAVEHWKADYEAQRLLRRADLAEDYAIAAILVAESSIEEAEPAVSEAIAADLAVAAVVSS